MLRWLIFSTTLLVSSAFAQQAVELPDDVKAQVDQLIQKGLGDEVGYAFVRDLTTEVGARLAGSPAEAKARAWSVQRLASLGFDNVTVESFEIPYWSRRVDRARIVEPSPQTLVVTALGGSTSTPKGGVDASIIRFEDMQGLRDVDASLVEGKIVFVDEKMTRTQDGSGYGMAVRKRRNCAKETANKGGLACMIRSVGTQDRRFAHTGMMARGEAVGDGPAAALSPPDADQLTRLLAKGPVRVHLDIQVETRLKAPSGNIVVDIRGRETPQEIVLIGCHLDSWDLGTGAVDDGAGCGIVVGAAQLINQLEIKPRRTVRVVLYGSEEVGLLGGFEYARKHADELPMHVLAAESDFGAGRVWRFETRFGEGALGYARAMQNALAPLNVTPGNNLATGGPDVSMLVRHGVPVVTPRQDGWDYFDLHHTPDDTLDKIDPEDFNQNVATYAAFVYLAAEMGWDFRRAEDAAL